MDPGIIALIGVGILNVISYIIAVRGRRRRLTRVRTASTTADAWKEAEQCCAGII